MSKRLTVEVCDSHVQFDSAEFSWSLRHVAHPRPGRRQNYGPASRTPLQQSTTKQRNYNVFPCAVTWFSRSPAHLVAGVWRHHRTRLRLAVKLGSILDAVPEVSLSKTPPAAQAAGLTQMLVTSGTCGSPPACTSGTRVGASDEAPHADDVIGEAVETARAIVAVHPAVERALRLRLELDPPKRQATTNCATAQEIAGCYFREAMHWPRHRPETARDASKI